MVITGYISKATSLEEIQTELNKIKNNVKKLADKIYAKQLADEVAFLCDQIALNVLSRDPKDTIHEAAVRNLNQRIEVSKLRGSEIEYNYNIFIQVMQVDGSTFYKVLSPGFAKYEKAFKDLQDYSLNETEADDENNGKFKAWTKLHSIYKETEPLAINITPIPSVPEKLSYETVPVRAETQARHTLLNHYLSIISGGAQIQPFLLMRYMDKALEMLVSEEGRRQMNRKKLELMNILPDLNSDDKFVYGAPGNSNTFELN